MNYLENTRSLFVYYKQLGDQAMTQLSEEELFWKYAEGENSIATIVKHLWGNMLSRWTNFLTEDGEKDWRKREEEFDESDIKNRAALLQKWEEGWDCLFKAINPLEEKDLEEIIYIRNQGHTVVEAMNRQLGHYAYHIGQMVLLAKLQKGKDWKSLSIPKGDSAAYNAAKFAKAKDKTHFTDEFIN